ncbi:MAG: PIN domain nuclease, partial [Clostridia bacterium]|nr:PIN domain nuclease [Clostridia bacterium]
KLVFAPGNGKIKIRDIKDQPILNAAIDFAIDILITGDKHFLELNLKNIQIITPSEYKKQYIP